MAYLEEIKNIWEMVRESFRQEYSEATFDLWFGSIELADYDPEKGEVTFNTTSEFRLKFLNERYRPLIEERFLSAAGLAVTVKFNFVGTHFDSESLLRRIRGEASPVEKPAETVEDGGAANRAKYTFDNFIEGDSNRFARAVCLQVAAHPYTVYNPLFIYGPSGVGKTHLMFAVINEIRRTMPETKVCYTKGDDFVNYLVDCIRNNNMNAFRQRYRSCDVLLVDDIQFIAGKEATQNELFHTFQGLFDEGKQIILASDRPPKDINPLEERLRSRFEGGLLADINPPNLELRVAILKQRAEDLGVQIPNEVLSFLAENLRSNIRQIEGAIKKLTAKSLVEGRQISMELARECIGELLGDAEPVDVTIEKIFSVIYKTYNVTKEELVGKKRNKEIVQARHVAIALIRDITEISLKRIGKIFSRDHATVMASIEVVSKRQIGDPLFAADYENLKKEILQR